MPVDSIARGLALRASTAAAAAQTTANTALAAAIAAELKIGLLAFYKFNENTGTTLYDSSPNGYNASFGGTAGSQWGTGKLGACLVFNGSDNYVLPPVGLNPIATGSFTYAVWVYQAVLTNGALIGFNSTNGAQFRLQSGKLNLVAPGSADIATSSGSLTAAAWNHVAVTFGNVSGPAFYINGAASGGNSTTHTFVASQSNIGANPNGGSRVEFFVGSMDEFGIWNRALSANEIAALYNNGTGISYPFW